MCTVVCTVRAATLREILLRCTPGAGAAAGAEAVADGANKAMVERAKSEFKAGAAAAAAASFKVDNHEAVVVLPIGGKPSPSGGKPSGIGSCHPSRSPCRLCVCFRCTC